MHAPKIDANVYTTSHTFMGSMNKGRLLQPSLIQLLYGGEMRGKAYFFEASVALLILLITSECDRNLPDSLSI